MSVVVKRQPLLLPGLQGLYPEKCNGKTARKTVSLRGTQQIIACVAGGIRGRGKVLVYERRSREENGEERL